MTTANQQKINAWHEYQLQDGVLDVYVDTQGIMRNNGRWMNSTNVDTIIGALEYFDTLTGVDINFVDTEDKSELSIHKITAAPGEGLEKYAKGNPYAPWIKGLVHAKYDDNNVYFEGNDDGQYTQYVIYHELAHIFGMDELIAPFQVSSDETIMGYDFTGQFNGYAQGDMDFFADRYGGYNNTVSMTNLHATVFANGIPPAGGW